MKKQFLLLLTLFSFFSTLQAQSENVIVHGDSLMIFRNRAEWRDRDVPNGYKALYLPNISKSAGRRTVLKHLGIATITGFGSMGLDQLINPTQYDRCAVYPYEKTSCSIEPGNLALIGGGSALIYGLGITPSLGNLKYKDKKRAAVGLGIRMAAVAIMFNENTNNDSLGGYLFAGGVLYSLATIPLSRRDYQARLRRYEIKN